MNGVQLSFIVAVNNDDILAKNIYASKIYRDGNHEFIFQRGYTNVPKAYNEAIPKAQNDLLLFCHQDVFFPDDWEENFFKALRDIENRDEDWAVLGIGGVQLIARFFGKKTGIKQIGNYFLTVRGGKYPIDYCYPKHYPQEVLTLDEVLLVVKKRNALFDEKIPNNHFYGADLCLSFGQKGLKSYAISAYLHHNMTSNWVGRDFYVSAEYIYNKYREQLPIATPCVIIEEKNGKPKFHTDFIALFELTSRSMGNRLSKWVRNKMAASKNAGINTQKNT